MNVVNAKEKTIVVKPIHVVLTVLALVLAIVGFYAASPAIASAMARPTDAETAATSGALAFLNRDVAAGKAAWVQAVCDVSTTNGCTMMREFYAPSMWSNIEKAPQAKCSVSGAELYRILPSIQGNEIQAWKLTGSCAMGDDHPKSGEMYVLIVKANGSDGYLFDHMMSNEEIKKLDEVTK